MYEFQVDLERAKAENGRDAITVQRSAYQELLCGRVTDMEAWQLAYNLAPDCAHKSLRYAVVWLSWDDMVDMFMAIFESSAQLATRLDGLVYYCEAEKTAVFTEAPSVTQFQK